MPSLLTTSSVLMCPHGGTVTASSSNTQAKAGDFIVRPSDTFTIAGCPFTLPSGTPHPCMTVQWVKSTLRCKAGGDFALAQDSVGLCLAGDQAPQGTVLIQSTQARVSGQ
ncbi:MAG TPA: hypothetical protein VG986_11110 [Pseudolabrys sp.]|nr:hypothetical protein [Pseudolabrys sp.]